MTFPPGTCVAPRERIKEGDVEAKQTLYFVLKNLAKLMAPLAPFSAEDIWTRLRTETDVESVHLTDWPLLVSPNRYCFN
ncbi:MAG: class I tRNA ligase family protein [bacterium]